jgi:hypothetical protein
MHSKVIDSAVICTAESLTPLCKYDTTVTFYIIFARLWLLLKGIFIEKTNIGQLSYTIPVHMKKYIQEKTIKCLDK